MKYDYIEVCEQVLFFKKDNESLILESDFVKTWYVFPTQKKCYTLGFVEVKEDELNQLIVIDENDSYLHCVIYYKYDFENHIYGDRQLIKNTILEVTKYKNIIMSDVLTEGNASTDLYAPLHDTLAQNEKFEDVKNITDFIRGKNIHIIRNQAKMHSEVPEVPEDTETLVIVDSQIKDLDFLIPLEHLKSIIVQRSVVGNWDGIENKTDLRSISIEASSIPSTLFFRKMDKLEQLEISACSLSEVKGLENKKELVYCDLSYNNLSIIDCLYESTKLRYLIIAHCLFEDIDVLKFKELLVLEINNNGCEEICNLDECKKLRFIDYSYNMLSEESMIFIHFIKSEYGTECFDFLEGIEI